MRNAFGGSVSAVSGSECVVYENVCERSQFLGKFGVVFLFFFMETNVFEQNGFSVFERSYLFLSVFADDVVCHGYFAAEKLVKSFRNRL